MSALALDQLELLPFAEQRALLTRACDLLGGDALQALLLRLVPSADHEPLVHLAQSLVVRDLVRVLGDVLPVLLLRLSDTGVMRLLPVLPASLAEELAAALKTFPLERLPSRGLIERWLRHQAPKTLRRCVDEAKTRVQAALEAQHLPKISDLDLAALSGQELAELEAPKDLENLWITHLSVWSERVLRALQGAPRSLSQASAEHLLSRRIYADQAHALHELLQNAEDAGASTLVFAFSAQALTISHDGHPLDALDVVGLLSVGQSTKQTGQLGTFGVGFKSVYALCDRPQVYSPFFNFEVADVSIPRHLKPPSGIPQGWTRFVLPWREDLKPAAQDAILKAALALPAELLLTLRSLQRIEVKAPSQARAIKRSQVEHEIEHIRQIVLFDGDEATAYWVAQAPSAPGVLVAAALDAHKTPQPRSPSAPNLFCYLPTRERAPLRVLVHAPFEVPVDRERVLLDSARNRAFLAHAGEALGLLVAHTKALDLIALPTPRDHEAFGELMGRVHALLREAPLFDANTRRVSAPKALWLGDPILCETLCGVEMVGERAVVRGLTEEVLSVARWLGLVSVSAAQLVTWLQENPERCRAISHEVGPARLLEALSRAPFIGAASRCEIFPDDNGKIHALSGLWLPSGVAPLDEIAKVLGSVSLVEAEAARACGPWLLRLGARRWSLQALWGVLGQSLRADQIPELQARLSALRDHLSNIDRQHLASLPVWLDSLGQPSYFQALRAPASDPSLEDLAALLDPTRAPMGVASLRFADVMGLGGSLWRPDYGWLLKALAGRERDTERLREHPGFWRALDAAAGAVSERGLWTRLRGLPLWEIEGCDGPQGADGLWSAHGAVRPLMSALGWPLVAETQQTRCSAILARVGVERVQGPQIAEALEGAQNLLPILPLLAAALAEVEPIDEPTRRRLSALPLWPKSSKASLLESKPLEEIAPLEVWRTWSGWSQVADHLKPYALALRAWLTFEEPRALLVRFVQEEALVAAPLQSQRAPLHEVRGVLAILGWVGALEGLPLAVNAASALVRPPLWDVSWLPDGIRREAGFSGRCAEPSWALGVKALGVEAQMLARLEPRRVTLALMQAAPNPDGAEWLHDDTQRQALYAWTLDNLEAISADPQALGTLGKAHIIRTRGGRFQAPELLLVGEGAFDDALAETLCPDALIEGLDRLYRLSARRRAFLLEAWSARLRAASQAQSERDMLAVLGTLPVPLPLQDEEVRRYALHKIKLLGTDGAWHRAHRMVYPPTAKRRGFLAKAGGVPVLSGGFAAALGEWVSVLGVADRVRFEVAEGWLKSAGKQAPEGTEAWFKLLYIADEGDFGADLQLGARAWIPDQDGTLRTPNNLQRAPTSQKHLIKGPFNIHPAWEAEVPSTLLDKLPFAAAPEHLPESTPPPKPSEDEKPTRWWHRLLSKRAPEPTASPPPQPLPATLDQRPDDSAWFRDRAEVQAQLRSAQAWLDDRRRPPKYGFAFAPPKLPKPSMYAPQLIAPVFDVASQRWLPDLRAWDAQWLSAAETADGECPKVVGRGQLPQGEVVLPVPMYARPEAQTLKLARTAGIWQASGIGDQALDITWHLGTCPTATTNPIDTRSIPEVWLKATVPDAELPGAALAWLQTLEGLDPWSKAREVEGKIRASYAYDPSYLEDEALAQRLRNAAANKTSAHLAALHAGAGAGFWGRGVCYELNALAVEWLRRVGVPAAFCVGWTLERGALSEPDHAWAVALLPTVEGLRLWPIDGSSTRDGRPLRVAQRPPGPWHVEIPRDALPLRLPKTAPRAQQQPSSAQSSKAQTQARPTKATPEAATPPPASPATSAQDAIAEALSVLAEAAHLPPQNWRAVASDLSRAPQKLKAWLAALSKRGAKG